MGYQSEFLQAYQPNVTFYLPQPVRAQLHRMGRTGPGPQPAGTYGRAVLDRLLIDLSWASSHLEGNTYTRLDTRALIAHGQLAQGHGVTETQMILNHKAAIELLMLSDGPVNGSPVGLQVKKSTDPLSPDIRVLPDASRP